MGFFANVASKIGSSGLLKKVGSAVAKGAGLLAKGAVDLGKKLIGKGNAASDSNAKAAGDVLSGFTTLFENDKKSSGSGTLSKASTTMQSKSTGDQGGVQGRLKMAFVMDWLKANWYVPLMAIVVILGIVFWSGKKSTHKRRRR